MQSSDTSISPAQRSAQLRSLIARGVVTLPGAYNALSARLIEAEGFDAMYLSGAVLANSVGGVPDIGLMSLTEARDHADHIARSTTIPIFMDADTGYGGPENAARTVQALEAVGVSGIHLEDQEFPKRCGHLDGKRLVPEHEFCEKIAAARAAKTSPDFVIIARTDARGVTGYDDAVRRAHLYLKAGADGIFPEALETREEFERFAKDVGVNRAATVRERSAGMVKQISPAGSAEPISPTRPQLGGEVVLLANMTEFGKTPHLTADEFGAIGYNLVIFPVSLQRVAMKATQEALRTLKRERSLKSMLDRMQTRTELYDLLGYKTEDSKNSEFVNPTNRTPKGSKKVAGG